MDGDRNSKKPGMMVRFALYLLLGAAVLFAAEPGENRVAASQAARDYMAAIDDGDLDRQMEFWSQDPGATSVIMGEIWQGKTNIRARSAEYVPVSKHMRNELGEVMEMPLGQDTVLTIVPYRSVRRNPEDERLKPFELESMLTLIWKQTVQDWRIIHEHVSVKIAPPTGK